MGRYMRDVHHMKHKMEEALSYNQDAEDHQN